jgi:hypothetical protein
MNLLFKSDRRFSQNEAREKKEQESFVERMFRHSRTYIQLGLAFTMCFVRFIAIYLLTQIHEIANSQNVIPTPKQQIIVPIYDGGTNVKLNTTHTGREKFLDTSPEALAPP